MDDKQVEAAEAATEVGHKDDDPYMEVFVQDVIMAITVFAVICLFGLAVWGAWR